MYIECSSPLRQFEGCVLRVNVSTVERSPLASKPHTKHHPGTHLWRQDLKKTWNPTCNFTLLVVYCSWHTTCLIPFVTPSKGEKLLAQKENLLDSSFFQSLRGLTVKICRKEEKEGEGQQLLIKSKWTALLNIVNFATTFVSPEHYSVHRTAETIHLIAFQ